MKNETKVTMQDSDVKYLGYVLRNFVIQESFYPEYWSEQRRDDSVKDALNTIMVEDERDFDSVLELGKAVEVEILSTEANFNEYGGFRQPDFVNVTTSDPYIRNFEILGGN